MRRALSACCLLVLVLFVLRHPLNAAVTVQVIGHTLSALADAVAVFTSAL